MSLEEKYQDDYILLACLREYVENGSMLASVNFWRDSIQNFQELNTIDHRSDILKANPKYQNNAFLQQFVQEDFPEIDNIPDDILGVAFSIIEIKEGRKTLLLTKEFLLEYATAIAKASKESWLAFIGIGDSTSEAERRFLHKLKILLGYSEYRI